MDSQNASMRDIAFAGSRRSAQVRSLARRPPSDQDQPAIQLTMPTMQDIAVPPGRARVQQQVSTWEPQTNWEGDDLSAARGIATGVALGAVMWCAIGLLLWVLL
jgi:hypothetical protein